MSKRRAPPGTYWRGDTLWGRLTVKGEEFRWSLRTGDVEIAAERYKARKQREIAASHYGDARKTWDDAVVAWSEFIVGNVSPNTAKRYGVSMGQLEPHLKGLYLDEIDKPLMSAIVRDRRARGASNATIRRDLGAAGSVLTYCEHEGWRDDNPALAWLRLLKERRDPIVLPLHSHVDYVVRRAPGLFAKLIDAARYTGCRQEELVGLTRQRVDIKRRQFTVIGKKNKLRTLDMLDAYDVFRSIPANLKSKFVFWHDDGDFYANVSSRFAGFCHDAQKTAQQEGVEMPLFPFHNLRHLFAVDYLKAGKGSIYDLQQHLGHESVKTTEIYLKYLTAEEARLAKMTAAQKAAQQPRFSDDTTAENSNG